MEAEDLNAVLGSRFGYTPYELEDLFPLLREGLRRVRFDTVLDETDRRQPGRAKLLGFCYKLVAFDVERGIQRGVGDGSVEKETKGERRARASEKVVVRVHTCQSHTRAYEARRPRWNRRGSA